MINLITNKDTINATTELITNIIASSTVKANPNFHSFKRLAPNMTGIAKKKVYSAATVRDTPINKAPTIVAPDLDVPGKIAAIN